MSRRRKLFVKEYKGHEISYRKGKTIIGKRFKDAWIGNDYIGMFRNYKDIIHTVDSLLECGELVEIQEK
jgi:hypothetical protein